ncbi:hypothetical protein ACEWY4_023687 [Coilia grayii]|uniref:MHC class I antigen n=1 Tax=Coilia grayii TaxID=363190 RepID=A0ABD1IY73_9TELE
MGVYEFSYDGMAFLSFDDNSMQWVAPVSASLQTKRKWDGVPILNQYTKGYLEKECVEWLDKFQRYGDIELAESLKSYPPKVHIFAKNGREPGKYLLTCMATGFYPKDIKMSILKNDWREKDGHEADVLPNGDAAVLPDAESFPAEKILGVAGVLLSAVGLVVLIVFAIKDGWFRKECEDGSQSPGGEPVPMGPEGSLAEEELLSPVGVDETWQGGKTEMKTVVVF